MRYVTCMASHGGRECGWVSVARTKAQVEDEVARFNEYYYSLPTWQRETYWSAPSSVDNYRCLSCGGRGPYRSYREGDCPDGCTINPVLCESTVIEPVRDSEEVLPNA